MKVWQTKHPDYARQYYIRNRERIIKQTSNWSKLNPEKRAIYNVRQCEKNKFGRLIFKYLKNLTSTPVGEEIVFGKSVYKRMK